MAPSRSSWFFQILANVQFVERSHLEPSTTMESSTPLSAQPLCVPAHPEENSTADNEPVVVNEIPARSFTLFPKLPAEVQLNVWKCATELESRDIQVTLAKKTISGVDIGYIKAITPPPAILHTCHDARVAGLMTHTILAFKHMSKNGQDMIYSTPELDTILVHLPEWTSGLSHPYGTLGPTTSPWQDSTHEMWYLRFSHNLAYDHLRFEEGRCFIFFPIQSKRFESNQISHLTQALRRTGNDCVIEWNLKWTFKGWQPFFFSFVAAVEHMSSCEYLYWSHLNGGKKFLINRIKRIEKSTGRRSRDTDPLRSTEMPAFAFT